MNVSLMSGQPGLAAGAGPRTASAPPRCAQRRRVQQLALPGALLLAGPSHASEGMSFLDPQGPIAAAAREHFILVTAILLIFVALPVFIGTIWFAWRYRYGATRPRYTPKWMFSTPIEVFTWLGPIVIVAFLSVMVWRSATALDPYHPIASSEPPLRVQVIGYDWKWLFIYPEQGIASVGLLALPAGRPVTMELTSATVMQSFYIPALASQIYAMGGMVTQLNLQADQPGCFLGENTMYSGDGFHQQKFPAVAMKSADFDAWAGRVRGTGMVLDAAALARIAAQGSTAQLRAALPEAARQEAGVYFTGVSPTLFRDVVMAVMGDAAPSPSALPPASKGHHP